MALFDLALLTQDQDFRLRCIASATLEKAYQPEQWVWANIWDLAGSPGFADAYASALLGEVEFPGRDQAVISDGQVVAAVQALLSAQNPPVG